MSSTKHVTTCSIHNNNMPWCTSCSKPTSTRNNVHVHVHGMHHGFIYPTSTLFLRTEGLAKTWCSLTLATPFVYYYTNQSLQVQSLQWSSRLHPQKGLHHVLDEKHTKISRSTTTRCGRVNCHHILVSQRLYWCFTGAYMYIHVHCFYVCISGQ